MEYQEASTVFGEIKNLIRSRIEVLMNDENSVTVEGAGINYRQLVESFPEISRTIEELTASFFQEFRDNPFMDKFLMELSTLTDSSFRQNWELHRTLQLSEGQGEGNHYRNLYLLDLTKYYYDFRDFLHYCAHKLKEQPVILACGKKETAEDIKSEEKIVYGVALLHLIGFFEWPLVKKLEPEKQRTIIRGLVGGSDRTIQGYVNVLNPGSREDRTRYTTNMHLEGIRKMLREMGVEPYH